MIYTYHICANVYLTILYHVVIYYAMQFQAVYTPGAPQFAVRCFRVDGTILSDF